MLTHIMLNIKYFEVEVQVIVSLSKYKMYINTEISLNIKYLNIAIIRPFNSKVGVAGSCQLTPKIA